jgi:hypothetical protein
VLVDARERVQFNDMCAALARADARFHIDNSSRSRAEKGRR